ncbi:hypothetical protein ZMO1_ZMO2076 [Zymomonas mobilis subsp. mobilis ZM4 = ATCC 31821]|nr:hypothetical protein ZMO1_ZMO2076 [Zymomonas mobilis subsp. mobilis ZM4 = ATCC 31821]HCE37903.1 hypothetical protein [Zymomonas mobilis]
MIVLRLLGRNCPEPWQARRSASGQGSKTADRPQACEHAQARINDPGRRRQGSAPNGCDSARSTGRSPRARRRYAGTHNYGLSSLRDSAPRDSSRRRVFSSSFCSNSASGNTVR